MSLINAILEQLLNGLRTGSIYALIALGYTMVYGIAKMINFAHGDIIMVGCIYAVCLRISSASASDPGCDHYHTGMCTAGSRHRKNSL